MTTTEFLTSAHASRALLAAGKLLFWTGPARGMGALVVHRVVRARTRRARTARGRARLRALGIAFDMIHGRTPEYMRARLEARKAARVVAR